jgi:hypothetical protein
MHLANYLTQLNESTTQFINAVQLTPVDKLNDESASKWGALSIAEHVYLVEFSMSRLLKNNNLNTAAEAEIIGKDKLQRIIINLRAKKMPSPEAFIPKQRWQTVQQAIEAFESLRQKLANDLQQGNIIIDNRQYTHPYLGDMTITDWLHFIIAHSQRHLLQIQEL